MHCDIQHERMRNESAYTCNSLERKLLYPFHAIVYLNDGYVLSNAAKSFLYFVSFGWECEVNANRISFRFFLRVIGQHRLKTWWIFDIYTRNDNCLHCPVRLRLTPSLFVCNFHQWEFAMYTLRFSDKNKLCHIHWWEKVRHKSHLFGFVGRFMNATQQRTFWFVLRYWFH